MKNYFTVFGVLVLGSCVNREFGNSSSQPKEVTGTGSLVGKSFCKMGQSGYETCLNFTSADAGIMEEDPNDMFARKPVEFKYSLSENSIFFSISLRSAAGETSKGSISPDGASLKEERYQSVYRPKETSPQCLPKLLPNCLVGKTYCPEVGAPEMCLSFQKVDGGLLGSTNFTFNTSPDGVVYIIVPIDRTTVSEQKLVLASDGSTLASPEATLPEAVTWTLKK